MSDSFCSFEEEIRYLQQVAISPLGLYSAGLARANARENVKLATLLNFIEKIEKDLDKVTCYGIVRSCVMYKISLGKLGEAKKITNLILQGNKVEVDKLIQTLSHKEKCESVDSPKIPQERPQVVPPPQIPIHNPVQSSPINQHQNITNIQTIPNIPYNPHIGHQHPSQVIAPQFYNPYIPPTQFNTGPEVSQVKTRPNPGYSQQVQFPSQQSVPTHPSLTEIHKQSVQSSTQFYRPPTIINPSSGLPVNTSMIQAIPAPVESRLAQETLDLISQLRQEMEGSKPDPNLLAYKQQEEMYRKRLEEEKASEELAKKLQEEFKNEISTPQSSIKCALCLEQAKQDFITLKSCGHIFHIYCLRNHLQMLIDNQVSNWDCPAHNCDKSISNPDIVTVCPPAMRNAIDSLKASGSLTRCLNKNCSYTFNRDPKMTSYTCPSCRQSFCLLCNSKHHPGQPCSIYSYCPPKAGLAPLNIFSNSRCPLCAQTVFRYKNGRFLWCECNNVFCPKCNMNESRCSCAY
jgi:hypothetical protein